MKGFARHLVGLVGGLLLGFLLGVLLEPRLMHHRQISTQYQGVLLTNGLFLFGRLEGVGSAYP